jgi:O-antigen/teichoic acid export membrane protein
VHEIAGSALTGAGLQRYRTGTQILATLLNLGLNLWLIPSHGWLGAAWASLATDGSLGVMNWSVLRFLTLKEARK